MTSSDTTRRETDALWFLDTLAIVHLSAGSNADGLSLIENRVPYGFSPPLHVHHTQDEAFHILSGEVVFTVGDQPVRARAGQTLVAPKGVPHSFIVVSPEGASWLNVTRGGDFEQMVRTVSRPAEHEGLPHAAGAPGPAEMAALEAACRASGIELTGAPMTMPLQTLAA